MADVVQANKGAVSSLADSDLVMCVASGGSYRPVSFANLRTAIAASNHAEAVFSSSINTWITIADGSATASWGGILTVTSGLWAGYPAMQVFAIGGRYKEAPVVSSLLGPTDKIKLRIVETDGRMRIDVKAITKKIEVNTMGIFNLMTPSEASAPSAENTVWEFDFSKSAWGGVIGYLPITYDSAEKGGAHDREETGRYAEGRADCDLGFGSLDDACECIGRVCEDWCDKSKSVATNYRPERSVGFMHPTAVLRMLEYARKNIDASNQHSVWRELLSDIVESRRRWHDIFPSLVNDVRLAALEDGIDDRSLVADRKEVAYAD